MTARSRTRDERGYVIVYVLALMAIALTLGAAALAETLNSRQLTTRDMRTRRAQQAADAGIQSSLYQASESNFAQAYNFTGGVLGLSTFLDCTVPQLDVNLQVVGLTAFASTAGACPTALLSGGTTTTSTFWRPLDNHAYYESEFFTNKKEVNGTGVGSVVEFPEIVSIGCDSTSAVGCHTTPASSSNAYSRELALLQPTGPVQAIEGMGNVVINGLSLLGINTAAVVNGDVMAGGTLTLPAVGIAANTSWPTSGTPILPTFGYGQTPAPASISTATLVHLTGGFCSTGNPSTSCQIKRPIVSSSATSCGACATGITCSSCSGGAYNASNDTFTLTGGTATFTGGDYVFCNFNATGGTINMSPTSTTPVRIFILPPNQSPCSANGYIQNGSTHLWNGGNFNASQGLGNGLTGIVNGVTGTLDPSGVQIYVAGDGSYDNDTTAFVGDTATCLVKALGICISASTPSTQAMVMYAPTSAVTINTGVCLASVGSLCTLGVAGTFSGSIVGDNVTTTAAAITQDLDLGNYPIESGANSFHASEFVQCSPSVTSLSNNLSTDTSGC
jgi:hypothetical protein